MKQRNMTSVFLCCENKILLLYRQGSRMVNNVWIGSAGGHFEPEELNDAEGCVLRELKEELGIDKEALRDLRMKYIMLRHVNGEVRVNYFFFAGLPEGTRMELKSEEGVLWWFELDEIKDLEMPLSTKYAMEHYRKEGRFTHMLYAGVVTAEGTDGKAIFTPMPEM